VILIGRDREWQGTFDRTEARYICDRKRMTMRFWCRRGRVKMSEEGLGWVFASRRYKGCRLQEKGSSTLFFDFELKMMKGCTHC
jgi:hypothetical protein